ncbi:unnamed protein product [Hapterophycus canaliculatus]
MAVELYAATTQKFNTTLLKDVRRALNKILFLNCDLWTSKVSGEKFIGEYSVFYMDEKMIMRTFLLAMKLFRPGVILGKVTGGVLMKWCRQVLAQHGLRPTDFAGAVSDAGSDVSAGVGKEFCREWCIPHMLNRATIDGTGMANKRASSKNTECRDLLEDAKKIIEHFNRSSRDKIELEDALDAMSNGRGSKAKLSQAVAERWISICKTLLRLLQQWDALKNVYVSKDDPFPLAKLRNEEVYSIVSEIKDITVFSQTTHEATTEGVLRLLILLLTETF